MCWAVVSGVQCHDGVLEDHRRRKLTATLRSVQSSYAIFWSISTRQQGNMGLAIPDQIINLSIDLVPQKRKAPVVVLEFIKNKTTQQTVGQAAELLHVVQTPDSRVRSPTPIELDIVSSFHDREGESIQEPLGLEKESANESQGSSPVLPRARINQEAGPSHTSHASPHAQKISNDSDSSPILKLGFTPFDVERFMAHAAPNFEAGVSVMAQRNEVFKLALENAYFALMRITTTGFYGTEYPNFVRVHEALFGERQALNRLHNKCTTLKADKDRICREWADFKVEAMADKNQLEENVCEFSKTEADLTFKLAKSKETKLIVESNVKKVFQDLETEQLLHSESKATWEKEKTSYEATIANKNGTIQVIKERLKKARADVREIMEMSTVDFNNCLAVYTKVGYYFQSQLNVALGNLPLPMAPNKITPAIVKALNKFLFKRY